MTDDTPLPFDLPAVARRKLTVDFDGGNQSSNGGLLLLHEAERQLGVCARLADTFRDRRDPRRILHTMSEMVAARVFAICCGYADGNDLNLLRHDPAMKMAVGRAPETGAPLCSQSTLSRLETAPTRIEAARLTGALVDQFGATTTPGKMEILDIDDTVDEVHGGQQLGLWNAHYDCRCFLPIHVYHVRTGKPVVAFVRAGKTPKGKEVATVLNHLTKRLRRHWPTTQIVYRGDSHYGRHEAMDWAEANEAGYIFGFAGNKVLDGLVADTVADLSHRHSMSTQAKMRAYTSVQYQAKSWSKPRRVVARIEASMQPTKNDGVAQEIDIRYVVTSLAGDAQHLYDEVYCQRGQMENLIKLHKAQLASDRTSCHSATANQVRLVLHTAAFWLMHAVRAAIPATSVLAKAEFATIRERLLKVGARVIEHLQRLRVHLPTSCPDRALFRAVALNLVAGVMPAAP
jgi:Transposase DDE domain group 1